MSETEAPSALWERLEGMAAAGCKRFRPLTCPSGDGQCFNCQAADIVARRRARQTSPEVLRRKDAIITSLQREIAAGAAQRAVYLDWMDQAADLAGGGRKLAEYRLNKIVNITLDMVGALIEADEQIEALSNLADDLSAQ